jgi:hypothetical protein
MREEIQTYEISPDGLSITCKRCKLTSHNPNDVAQRYCGRCHVFHENLWPPSREWWLTHPEPTPPRPPQVDHAQGKATFEVQGFIVHTGLRPPNDREMRRVVLDGLLVLADQMAVGDAVELRLAQAQQMRVILAAKGYECKTDGYSCRTRGKTLVFKLAKPVTSCCS